MLYDCFKSYCIGASQVGKVRRHVAPRPAKAETVRRIFSCWLDPFGGMRGFGFLQEKLVEYTLPRQTRQPLLEIPLTEKGMPCCHSSNQK